MKLELEEQISFSLQKNQALEGDFWTFWTPFTNFSLDHLSPIRLAELDLQYLGLDTPKLVQM